MLLPERAVCHSCPRPFHAAACAAKRHRWSAARTCPHNVALSSIAAARLRSVHACDIELCKLIWSIFPLSHPPHDPLSPPPLPCIGATAAVTSSACCCMLSAQGRLHSRLQRCRFPALPRAGGVCGGGKAASPPSGYSARLGRTIRHRFATSNVPPSPRASADVPAARNGYLSPPGWPAFELRKLPQSRSRRRRTTRCRRSFPFRPLWWQPAGTWRGPAISGDTAALYVGLADAVPRAGAAAGDGDGVPALETRCHRVACAGRRARQRDTGVRCGRAGVLSSRDWAVTPRWRWSSMGARCCVPQSPGTPSPIQNRSVHHQRTIAAHQRRAAIRQFCNTWRQRCICSSALNGTCSGNGVHRPGRPGSSCFASFAAFRSSNRYAPALITRHLWAFRRVFPNPFQDAPQVHQACAIEVQFFYCGASDWCQGDNERVPVIPGEVGGPGMLPGMVDNGAVSPVADCFGADVFASVTAMARIRQVVERIGTAFRAWHDMLNRIGIGEKRSCAQQYSQQLQARRTIAARCRAVSCGSAIGRRVQPKVVNERRQWDRPHAPTPRGRSCAGHWRLQCDRTAL